MQRQPDPLDGTIQTHDHGSMSVARAAHLFKLDEILERVAADLGTSSSQAGAYLLATALIAYLQDQPEVPCVPSRSPRVAASVDLGPVLEALANSAEASKWVE